MVNLFNILLDKKNKRSKNSSRELLKKHSSVKFHGCKRTEISLCQFNCIRISRVMSSLPFLT